jgi:hypothetical protein
MKKLFSLSILLLVAITPSGQTAVLYEGLIYAEVKAKGPNTGGGRVPGERYRVELTVVFEVATNKIADILYTNTGQHTTGGNYEKLWTGENTYRAFRPNHVTGYPGLITAIIGRTAEELSGTSTSTSNNGANMPDAVSGATQTTSNFISSVKTASQEYLKGNAVRSDWKKQ